MRYFLIVISAFFKQLWWGGLAIGLTLQVTASTTDLDRQAAKIILANCFTCHGPDPDSRKANLRFDQPLQDQIPARVLIERINSSDPEAIMPPPKSGKDLTRDDIQILEHWVEDGAN